MIDLTTAGLDIETRPYQLRIVRAALESFFAPPSGRGQVEPRGANSVLIESPTGSGKTIVGLWIAQWAQQRFGYRIGWVAMRRNLLAQAAAENRQRGFGVQMELISMFDKCPPQVDLLVVDEAQHDAALSMANLHGMIRPQKILGLSATPYRTDQVKLCFEQVLHDADIHHLIQTGYLSPYHHYTIERYTPETVAECYVREPQRWGQSLIFFHRWAQCEACCRALRRGGIRCEVVTATSDRDRQLDDFVAGQLDVLLSMTILAEGFDCPSLRTVFCRPSGKSCSVQMGGRVFRKHPAMPFKQIVQCRETRHPFPRTAAPAEQYVWSDGGWRTLKLNRQLAAISANALRLVAACPVEIPEFFTAPRPRRSPPWLRRGQQRGDGVGEF